MDARRIWKLRVSLYGLNDAPAAFRSSLRKYLVNPVEPRPKVGLEFEASRLTRVFSVFRKSGGAAGAVATHIEDSSGCGEPDRLLKVRRYLGERSGKLKAQERSLYTRAWNSLMRVIPL